MKILVTGGAGFIGSNFILHSLNLGHEIINIDALTYAGNLDNLKNCTKNPNYTFYHLNICNKEKITEILCNHQPDVVMHMAAESHVDRSIDCADDFIQTNICGTHSMLDACRHYVHEVNKTNFKFIHLSTDEVFGALGKEGKFHEGMPYRPNSPYAASKASSDLLVRSYFQTYEFPAIIVNASNNYGPRQYPEKLIPLVILNALEGKPIPIYGDGKQVRDWLFVEDHVRALLSIIDKGRVGESYCIGSDNEITNHEIVTKICSLLDIIKPANNKYAALITYVKDRPGHDFRYATDATKLERDTGWKARQNFNDGLEQTIHWYIAAYDRLGANKSARNRIGLGN